METETSWRAVCEIQGKLNIVENVQYLLSVVSESETVILYKFMTHTVKYFNLLFLVILMILAHR